MDLAGGQASSFFFRPAPPRARSSYRRSSYGCCGSLFISPPAFPAIPTSRHVLWRHPRPRQFAVRDAAAAAAAAAAHELHRPATSTDLILDLVFVVIVANLGTAVKEYLTRSGEVEETASELPFQFSAPLGAAAAFLNIDVGSLGKMSSGSVITDTLACVRACVHDALDSAPRVFCFPSWTS